MLLPKIDIPSTYTNIILPIDHSKYVSALFFERGAFNLTPPCISKSFPEFVISPIAFYNVSSLNFNFHKYVLAVGKFPPTFNDSAVISYYISIIIDSVCELSWK